MESENCPSWQDALEKGEPTASACLPSLADGESIAGNISSLKVSRENDQLS